jgi:hypothetical protein
MADCRRFVCRFLASGSSIPEFSSRAPKDFLSYWGGVMIAPDGLTDLVGKAQAGNRGAQEELLGRIRSDLNRFAEQFGDSSLGAESIADLAQECALRF